MVLRWIKSLGLACIISYAIAYGPIFGLSWLGALMLGYEYPAIIAASLAWISSWAIFPICPYIQLVLLRWSRLMW